MILVFLSERYLHPCVSVQAFLFNLGVYPPHQQLNNKPDFILRQRPSLIIFPPTVTVCLENWKWFCGTIFSYCIAVEILLDLEGEAL